MLILSAQDVDTCLPMKTAIEGMRHAFAASSAGELQMPDRSSVTLNSPSSLALFMPAHIKDSPIVSVKTVTVVPTNRVASLPIVQSVVVAFDASTGSPVALLDGSRLTAIRTAAGGGVSVDLLSRQDSTTLAVMGSGTQAKAGIEAVCSVRNISKIQVFSPTQENAEKLVEEASRTRWCPSIEVVADPDTAVRNADIVWTATDSAEPTFSRESLQHGTHVVGIGSFQPSMIEIEPSLFTSASIFVDQLDACWAEAGEVIAARSQGLISPNDVEELGNVILGRTQGRTSSDEITIFKSVGIAAQDAVASQLALSAAKELGVGTQASL
tara:strand:+ start:2927 stop:3904 length:978 start_codon:yes stop_codon:yes gene_type:complete